MIHGTSQRRVISRRVHFVEIRKSGEAALAGFAPYLDYRAPNDEEKERVFSALQQEDWLKDAVEDIAVGYAIRDIIPAHLSEVRERKRALLDNIESAVKERLTSEIRYWDFRANELRETESTGKRNAKLNADQAARRAEDLTARLEKRLAEIAQERKITAMPPVVVGGAIIVPRGWFAETEGSVSKTDGACRAEIERIAMQAVASIERQLGYEPKDVSMTKCGYDIESFVSEERREDGKCIRFIEVKGRRADADTVTVSKNEILTALNKPDAYILAIVLVDGDERKITYLQKPFTSPPDFGAVSVTYRMDDLLKQGTCIFTR